jgi:tripartite-type tricarboxylate transporter receptor subunit TctC
VIEAIHLQIAAAMKAPEVAAFYRAQGLELVDKGPKDFEGYIARELAQWRPVIQRNNITLD